MVVGWAGGFSWVVDDDVLTMPTHSPVSMDVLRSAVTELCSGFEDKLPFFPRAEVESRSYRQTATMRGMPLDQVDEDWELKKEELERNPPCAQRSYATSAQKMQRKRRKQ